MEGPVGSRISGVTVEGDRLTFKVQCGYAGGVIDHDPLGERTAESVMVEGVTSVPCLQNEWRFGQNWALAVVPPGENVVTLNLKSSQPEQ